MTKQAIAISALAVGALICGPVAADPLEGKKSSAEILEASAPADWRTLDPEFVLYIETEKGRAAVALSRTLAAAHVAQIKTLAREGFYDGLSFYRVIDGFVAQGGDVLETREVKKGKKTLKAQFDEIVGDDFPFNALGGVDGYAAQSGYSQSLPTGLDPETGAAWHLHCTGAIAMARGNDKDTAGTEFYVALQPQRYLDRNLTVFGRVVEGMEVVQSLRRVAPAESAEDDLGDKIISIKVAADLPPESRNEISILRSDTPTFAAYAAARRNRPEAFFHYRPDYIDVCSMPIPVRSAPAAPQENAEPAGESQ